MFFQKVLLSNIPFSFNSLVSAAISPSSSFPAARKADFWAPCEREGNCLKDSPTSLPSASHGEFVHRLKMKEELIGLHHMQGYYEKDLEQSSITFAKPAAP